MLNVLSAWIPATLLLAALAFATTRFDLFHRRKQMFQRANAAYERALSLDPDLPSQQPNWPQPREEGELAKLIGMHKPCSSSA